MAENGKMINKSITEYIAIIRLFLTSKFGW